VGVSPIHYGSGTARAIHYGTIEYDEDKKAKRTRIVSPYMSFETERGAMRTLRGMLKILAKRHFVYVVDFDGPELGITRDRDELVTVDEVLKAMEEMDDTDVPSFLGIRVVLMYKHDRDITAKLKVRIGGETKVKLKVKGTITKTTWNNIRAHTRRKFHVTV
jgi:hypothetical protein